MKTRHLIALLLLSTVLLIQNTQPMLVSSQLQGKPLKHSDQPDSISSTNQTTTASAFNQTVKPVMQNITVTKPLNVNLTARINVVKLQPWQALTPDGIRNASKMIIVTNDSVQIPPPENKSQILPSVSITKWIMDADYDYYYPTYPVHGSLRFMSAQWIVPPAPTSTGSTIFWFPGLQSGTHIIQPVLQYGGASDGGGNYWVLANWWVDSSYLVTTPTIVNTGDLIYGSMSWSGSYWTIHSRDVTTNTGPTDLNVADTDTYYNSVNTLEGYSISSCNQLSGGVSFESITLQGVVTLLGGVGTVTPSWSINHYSNSGNQGQCGIDSRDVILRSSNQVILNTADPQIYGVGYTGPVAVGGYSDITLTVTNLAGADALQTAQLSFPSPVSSLQVTSTDMSANRQNAGSSVWGCYTTCTVTTSYPFAEGSASFTTAQTHYITVRVYPSQAGTFQVNLKTVARVYGSSPWASDWAPTSGSTDQQQEYISSFSITVSPPQYQTLSSNVISGSGSISPYCPSGCSEEVGSLVSVTATPSANWQLSGWSVTGASCSGGSSSNPCQFTMPNNAVSVYAIFTPLTQSLVTSIDAGQGSISPNCPSGCSEQVGSQITVTATPSSGWQFSGWSTQGDVSCSGNPCVFSMPGSPVTLGVTFTLVPVTTTVTSTIMMQTTILQSFTTTQSTTSYVSTSSPTSTVVSYTTVMLLPLTSTITTLTTLLFPATNTTTVSSYSTTTTSTSTSTLVITLSNTGNTTSTTSSTTSTSTTSTTTTKSSTTTATSTTSTGCKGKWCTGLGPVYVWPFYSLALIGYCLFRFRRLIIYRSGVIHGKEVFSES